MEMANKKGEEELRLKKEKEEKEKQKLAEKKVEMRYDQVCKINHVCVNYT